MPQIQLALCRPTKNHEDILFALQTRLSANTTSSSSSREKRGRRSASTPPTNSMLRNESVPMTTSTTHHRKHINEIDVNVNRMSSNPTLQAEASNFVINNRRDNCHTSTIGPAREFLRKERRKRLF